MHYRASARARTGSRPHSRRPPPSSSN